MGKKKKKVFNPLRFLIIVLIIVIIAIIAIRMVIVNSSLDEDIKNKQDESINTTTASLSSLNEEVKISLNSYDVYFDEDDELGFNFIIANLKFVNENSSLYYDLSNLTTSEKIKLNNTESYLSKIKARKYDIGKFNLIDYQFTSDTGSLNGNVFIPFEGIYNELYIYNGEAIKFDLTKNKHNLTDLFYDVDTQDIKTDDYDISVSNSYTEIVFVTTDTNEDYYYPDLNPVLVFELYVNSIKQSGVHVENARFIPSGADANDYVENIDDHIDSYKIKNVINKNLNKGDKYGLFFQIDDNTPHTGKILIKLSDSDKMIEIKTGE